MRRDLIEIFAGYLLTESCLSRLTVRKYVYALRKLKSWARRKRKSLLELKTADCTRWKLILTRDGLKPGTVNGHLITGKRFFRFLQLDGYVEHNPFDLVELLPKPKTLPRYLSIEEVDLLLEAPDTSTYHGLLDRTILELLYSSGLRPAELVTLQLKKVDLSRRLLTCVGKGQKERVAVFGRSARRWLERYLSIRWRLHGKSRLRLLFVKENGEQLSCMYVWRHVKKHGLDAGLKDVTPRVIRHTYATHLHEGGAGIVEVQLLMRHERAESTEVYLHLVQKRLRQIYDQHHPRAGMKLRKPEKKVARERRMAELWRDIVKIRGGQTR